MLAAEELWLIVIGEKRTTDRHHHGQGGGDAGYGVTSCLVDSSLRNRKESFDDRKGVVLEG